MCESYSLGAEIVISWNRTRLVLNTYIWIFDTVENHSLRHALFQTVRELFASVQRCSMPFRILHLTGTAASPSNSQNTMPDCLELFVARERLCCATVLPDGFMAIL